MRRQDDPFQQFLDRLPRPPRAGAVPRRHIQRLVALAVRLLRRVQPLRLSVAQKKAMSGFLFWEGPMIVRQVVRGLTEHRACFPEITDDPAELEEGLRRAGHWLSLYEFGQMITQIAHDYYALEMSTPLQAALGILRHVRADRQRRYPGPHDEERAEAMAEAEDTLAAYRRRVERK